MKNITYRRCCLQERLVQDVNRQCVGEIFKMSVAGLFTV